MATVAEADTVASLVSGIPALAAEIRVEELIYQAESEGKLGAYGTISWIADMSGMDYKMVQNRVRKHRRGGHI